LRHDQRFCVHLKLHSSVQFNKIFNEFHKPVCVLNYSFGKYSLHDDALNSRINFMFFHGDLMFIQMNSFSLFSAWTLSHFINLFFLLCRAFSYFPLTVQWMNLMNFIHWYSKCKLTLPKTEFNIQAKYSNVSLLGGEFLWWCVFVFEIKFLSCYLFVLFFWFFLCFIICINKILVTSKSWRSEV
jgi:hypothetical protein